MMRTTNEEEKKLLSPGKIGRAVIKNRVIMAPVSTNFASACGEVTNELTAFYQRRAEGGVGAIILECVNVDFPYGKTGYTQLRFDDDRFIPSLSDFSEILHESGAKVFPQLNHTGGLLGDRSRENLRPIAPSPMLYGKRMIEAKEATEKDIASIRDSFIMAAERACLAGFDGVEIHGAHGYLLAEFMSPSTNTRNDVYGGSVENRARLAVEIVRGIKKSLPGFPVIFRISGDELVSPTRLLPEDLDIVAGERPEERARYGRDISETVEIVRLLAEAEIDAVHVTAGTHRFPHTFARRAQVEPMSYPEGWKAYLAREVKNNCSLPVITVGVIRSHETAEAILQRRDADFVALGRALVADPDWVKKISIQAPVRKCISCNTCVQYRSSYGRKLRCAVNAEAGREYRINLMAAGRTENPKRILVAGGGPAGLEFTRVAALRGHNIVLIDKSDRLGGKLKAASVSDKKDKIRWLIEWQVKEVALSGAEIRLGCNIQDIDFSKEKFDLLVMAVGAEADKGRVPPVDNIGDVKVYQAIDLLDDLHTLTGIKSMKTAVIGGGIIGCEIADILAGQENSVSVITRRTKDYLLDGMDVINRYDLYCRLYAAGVEIIDNAAVNRITNAGLEYIRNGIPLSRRADVVVLAQGLCPVSAWQTPPKYAPPMLYIGDCKSPRNIQAAVYEGFINAYRL